MIEEEDWDEIFGDDPDFDTEDEEEYSTVMNIPEPDRTVVLS